MKRKDFLKLSAKGVLGLSALPPLLNACTKIDASVENTQGAIASNVEPFPWPVQNPSYRTLLPRHGLYGIGPYGGDGSHPDNPVPNATRVYFIVNASAGYNGSYDPVTRVGRGSAWFCFGHSTADATSQAGSPQPNAKIIIPTVSGVVHLNKLLIVADDHTEYWGQFAPHPGLWFRNAAVAANHSHCLFWHMPSYAGDDDAGPAINNRDAGTCGMGSLTGNAWINCSFAWSTDEIFSGYNPNLLAQGWLYCMFMEPLYYNKHTDEHGVSEGHGFGPLIGTSLNDGASNTDKIGFQRCLFAHAQSRNPYVNVRRLAMSECLTYNWGRLKQGTLADTTGSGEGVTFGAANGNTQANIISSGWIKGKQNSNTNHNIICGSTNFSNVPGSKLYLANNAVQGYTIGSQGALLNNSYAGDYTGIRNGHFPAGFLSSGIMSDAIPHGWGSNFENVHRPWANPLQPTLTEWRNFIALMRVSCGPWPSRRTSAQGREEKIFDQLLAAVNGNAAGMGGQVNSVSGTGEPSEWPGNKQVKPNTGGWGQLPTTLVTVNPDNPGTHWVARVPAIAEGRDVPYTSGTFSNGLSRVGYSPLRVLGIEQHWKVGGM